MARYAALEDMDSIDTVESEENLLVSRTSTLAEAEYTSLTTETDLYPSSEEGSNPEISDTDSLAGGLYEVAGELEGFGSTIETLNDYTYGGPTLVEENPNTQTTYGTAGNDYIEGRTWIRDTIYGLAGDDFLWGGDELGPGDTILGGDGNDTIYGGFGEDALHGDAGDDVIDGGGSNDLIFGGDGNDELFGGDGNDKLYGMGGHDKLHGGEGNDVLHAGSLTSGGDGVLFGDAGDDVLNGSEGVDHLYGGEGIDILGGFGGIDYLDGGEGDDRLYGDAGDDMLWGRAGNDLLEGGDGYDWLDGGDGNDRLLGDGGNDVLNGGAGSDQLTGGAGRDTFIFTDADPIPYGGYEFDTIHDFEFVTDGTSFSGDWINLSQLFDQYTTFTGTSANEAWAQGYLYLVQHGNPGEAGFGTTIYIDPNGHAPDYYLHDFPVVELAGVASDRFDAFNQEAAFLSKYILV